MENLGLEIGFWSILLVYLFARIITTTKKSYEKQI